MAFRRKLLTNCILISFVVHTAILLIYSPYKEHPTPSASSKVDVDFVSLPKAKLVQRRFIEISRQSERIDPRLERSEYNAKYLPSITNRPVIQEATTTSGNPKIISTIADLKPDKMPVLGFRSDKTNDDSSIIRSSTGKSRGTSGRAGQSGGQMARAGGNIQPGESRARITGSGNSIKGYYNMSLVRYEDSSDTISSNALPQLAKAMNKWTQVLTKVINEPMRLDDPKLAGVPIIYIASRKPFAFSERERQNLRKFFDNGNFMIFTNSGENENQKQEVANSIGFELWRILGESARNLKVIEKSHEIFNGFFNIRKSNLPNLSGIFQNRRIVVIYDESGYGDSWIAERNDKDRPYLQMGVNIIAYALTTCTIK